MTKTLVAAALLGAASLAHAADGWKFLPLFTDPGHRLEPTLALTVDRVEPDGRDGTTATGVEFGFNCGLVQSPGNRIRSALKLHRSSENGLKATTFELAPRYMLPLGGGFTLGGGPSLASVRLSGTTDKTLWGAGVALAAEWRAGALFAGVDLRWHDLRRKDGIEYDNTAVGVKVGFAF